MFKKQKVDLKKQLLFKLVNDLESLASISDISDIDLVKRMEAIHQEFEDKYSNLITYS